MSHWAYSLAAGATPASGSPVDRSRRVPEPVAGLERLTARVAVHGLATEPPLVTTLGPAAPRDLLDQVAAAVIAAARVPAAAIREVVDNTVHAAFAGVLVTVTDAGATVVVADRGAGIDDPELARQPGVTTATDRERTIIRGAGAGLAIAGAALRAAGGSLELRANLGRGTLAILAVERGGPAAGTTTNPAPAFGVPRGPAGTEGRRATEWSDRLTVTERQRRCLALLADLDGAGPGRVAGELGLSTSTAHRELVTLERRGLVDSTPSGRRRLSARGTALLERLY